MEDRKLSRIYLRVDFWATFDIQIDITLTIFWEKFQNYAFEKAHRGLSKHANIRINRPPITKKRSFKKMKNLCFLLFFSKK